MLSQSFFLKIGNQDIVVPFLPIMLGEKSGKLYQNLSGGNYGWLEMI